MSFKMPSISTPRNRTDFKSDKGVRECVAFVRGVANAPATEHWRKGKQVMDQKPGTIEYGTAIATFDANGHYSNGGPGNQHAAIYISHDKDGIWVFDQYKSLPGVQKRLIHNNHTGKRSNDANEFSIIEVY